MKRELFDRPFLVTLSLLIISGLFIFVSGSLGLVARAEGASFSSIITKQLFFGTAGLVALYIASRLPYKFWRTWALHLFILSLVATLLVFIPLLGVEKGGAVRWISIGPISFQPGEFLKLGFVIYFAAWLATRKEKIESFSQGVLPMLLLLGVTTGILILQPHTGMAAVIFATAISMFFVAGGKAKHLFVLFLIGLGALGAVALTRPHVMSRILTFRSLESADPQGSGYQIRQSLIAVGSGGTFGKGFGQSAQKFKYLPEAVSDSIFAVAAEEFGFVGSVGLVALFLLYCLAGLGVASRAPDSFGRLLVVGLVILVVSQSFANMAAMVGLLPLSGIPVLFVSQGGTALFFTLLEAGIILSVSRHRA